MTTTLDLEQQVLPMLAQIEQDPSRRTAEFPMVIGRVLQGTPDQSTLRHLRSELAATASRLRGEHGVHDGEGKAAVTAEVVSGLANVIAGWVQQADAAARDTAPSASSVRTLILMALLDGPARPSDLADELERSRPQISEALRRLTQRELVTSAESAVDGRSRQFELTDRGRAAATS